MSRVIVLVIAISLLNLSLCQAQLAGGEKNVYTRADTIRGSITAERAWWDVVRYDLDVTPEYNTQTIKGTTGISFKVLKPGRKMQIDLQTPLVIDAIYLQLFRQSDLGTKVKTELVETEHFEKLMVKKKRLSFKRDGNAWYVNMPALPVNSLQSIVVEYHGRPRAAVRPPWDGGWIWTKDAMGRPWMSVACQGLGASVWYPCKDHQSDEPDSGAMISINVPDTLVAVANGRLVSTFHPAKGVTNYTWKVVNPINNYDIIPYIGKYEHFHKDYAGEKGKLDCDYWVMDYNLDKAKEQFKQADSMLHCFEYWMGPYPFYEDSYKLVEAPHLGMEHQSAVAYGNHYGNGYLGRDLSGTGWGLKWDFIIVHESGHEWFGNNITTKDLADMWVHEGFTNYSETLYTTCQYGVEAGNDYCIGSRQNIRNDKPIIASYGVNNEGSGDMYCKGGNMLHMIRQILGDEGYRGLLHRLSSAYYHQTVTSQQVESFISQYAKKDLSKIFDQYLRTTKIPVLEYKVNGSTLLSYRWTNCVKGFNMPVRVMAGGQPGQWITPGEEWKTLNFPAANTDGQTARDSAVKASDSAGKMLDPTGGAAIGNSGADSATRVPTASTARSRPVTEGNFQVDRNFYITVKKIG